MLPQTFKAHLMVCLHCASELLFLGISHSMDLFALIDCEIVRVIVPEFRVLMFECCSTLRLVETMLLLMALDV